MQGARIMARYIDADKLTDKLEELQFNAPVMILVMKIYNVIELVEDQPTADVVEVKCRCADCKHYQRYGRTSLVFEGKNVQAGWCMLRAKTDEEHRMLPFDFCSYGERKESDG